MSEKGDVQDGGGARRLIRRVAFAYRLESDPEGTERMFTLEHGGEGEAVDGLIWSEELIRKLAYLENGECREPKKGTGTGEWKLYSAERETDDGGKCLWVHDEQCNWWEYCDEME